MSNITEKSFRDYKWDCDICPLYPCHSCGFMLIEDCFDDVMNFWKEANIRPEYGFTQSILERGEI